MRAHPAVGPGDRRLITVRETVPENPDALFLGGERMKRLHLDSARPVPERAEEFGRVAQIRGFHPLDCTRQEGVVVPTVGGRLLPPYESRGNRRVQGVR